ncbi:hypothetical protein A3B57_02235 [Microgenomates group bacterium RIFCSPLOWO2_01_FULL_47_10]|nr:MAG: hypothetical protein A3B57_02235 [Microgenomates group bacterium RIFCSPLOWO2_01_FULL_47_10]
MKKVVILDPQADKEFCKLEDDVQDEFLSLIKMLTENGKLEYPDGKKIDKQLFEARVKIKNIYRGFYAYIRNNQIVILHLFQKKTQKTPLRNLKLAHKRLKIYE